MSTKLLSRFLAGSCVALVLCAYYVQAKGPGVLVTICHQNANGTYEEQTINTNGLNGHQNHPMQDIIPAPAGGCPAGGTTEVPEPIAMLLFGAGLVGVGYAAKRRKQRA